MIEQRLHAVLGRPNHWLDQPAASFGWTVEAAAGQPLRYAETMKRMTLPLISVLLLAGCYFPAKIRSAVRARVVDAESGLPIPDASVLRIVCDVHDFRCSQALVDRGLTDGKGRIKMKGAREWGFWFPAPGGLPAPNHQVAIWKKGYVPTVFSQYGTLEEFKLMNRKASFSKDLAEVPDNGVQFDPDSKLYFALFENGEVRLKRNLGKPSE